MTSPSSAPASDVLILTAEGRIKLAARLERAHEELALVDARLKGGQAGREDVGERQRLVETIDELERVLDQALEVTKVQEDPSIVEVGDEVDVVDDDGAVTTYALVHPAEADARDNRVSVGSPLGQALLGAKPGDRVTVDAPAGAYSCVIHARRRLL